MPKRELSQPEIDAHVQKLLAEAEQALATAEERRASASQHATEEAHTKLLIEHGGIENAIARIALEKVNREESFASVADLYHRVYNFDQAVVGNSVKHCINTLTAWSRQAPGCDITVNINSPGGDIIDGFALIDFLLELRRQGHKITTVALGMAASMAGVLLQAGTIRVMGANAILLVHEGSLSGMGSFGEMEDNMSLMGTMHDRILTLFESRAKPINPKTTKAFIKTKWKRRDWWVTSDEAVKLGFVDEAR